MGYCKKFSDICALFLAFWGAVYTVGRFISYKFEDGIGFAEKIKVFFSEENTEDMRSFCLLLLLLLLSLAAGRVLKQSYCLSFAVSTLPLIWAFVLYECGKLYTQPKLFLILCGAICICSFADALVLDRGDGKRRAYVSANIAGAALAALSFAGYFKIDGLLKTEMRDDVIAELPEMERRIVGVYDGESVKVFLVLGVILTLAVAASLALRDLYFVDLIFCVALAGYCVYIFFWEAVPLFSLAMTAPVLIWTLARVAIVFFEPMRETVEK